MVAEHWLLKGLVLTALTIMTTSGNGLGGRADFLGTGLRLNPPFSEEVTHENWETWSWKQKNYLAMEDPLIAEYLTELESQKVSVTEESVITYGDVSLNASTVSADLKNKRLHLASRLKYYLTNTVQGTNEVYLRSVQSTGDTNGFETWRLLAQKYRTRVEVAAHVLLASMMNFRFTTANFEKDLENFEVLKRRHEQTTGTVMNDSYLVSLMYSKTETALPEVNRHMRLHVENFTTYESIKTLILQYLKYSQNSVAAANVNALGKGGQRNWNNNWNWNWNNWQPKAKGKGNWNNNWNQKGKGKGKQTGKWNQKGNWSNSKGKGKGKGKGHWKFTPKGKGNTGMSVMSSDLPCDLC